MSVGDGQQTAKGAKLTKPNEAAPAPAAPPTRQVQDAPQYPENWDELKARLKREHPELTDAELEALEL